eukprot:GSMAST32.ASY1.ANO1.817.1 assembled CDS
MYVHALENPIITTHQLSFKESETSKQRAFKVGTCEKKQAKQDNSEQTVRPQKHHCHTETNLNKRNLQRNSLGNYFSSIQRKDVLKRLQNEKFLHHSQKVFWHGRLYSNFKTQPLPTLKWESKQKPRKDHDGEYWLTASEFCDTAAMMDEKCYVLSKLIQMSKRTILYTGAGISVAANINQAAAGSYKKSNGNSIYAKPTITHYCATTLANKGLIHGWVQQNHDGLPQKSCRFFF